jgi:hypothetical protein
MPAALHFGMLASDESLTRRQYVEDEDGRDVWFWYTTVRCSALPHLEAILVNTSAIAI